MFASRRTMVRALQVGAFLALLASMAVQSVQAQAAIQITRVRDLDFGYCDALPGTGFTVTAAEFAGGAACAGATSARFEITGQPNRVARVTLSKNVTVTNGAGTISVTLASSAGGPSVCLGATGALTLWVGGSFSITAAGLATSGPFTVGTDIALVYQGNKSC